MLGDLSAAPDGPLGPAGPLGPEADWLIGSQV